MLNKLKSEINHFKSQPHNFRILVLTNLVYAFVLPVIDIFVAAYVMRSSNDPTKVVIYQLTIYTGIPLTFLLNGYLLKHFNIRKLYSAGMMLSAVSMIIMMSLKELNLVGIGIAGLTMGLSFGFYWSNRDFLALAITNDENRNYYYGLETFFYTIIGVVIPITIGWFIESKGANAQSVKSAYLVITGAVFIVTVLASIVCFRGAFKNPVEKKYIYFKFHPLWYRLLILAALKGLAQGFLVTAPAMLIMLLIGKEGALGTAQSIGAVLAAVIMYVVGRLSKPADRIKIFALGLSLFALGAIVNGVLFNQMGVVVFILILLIAKPLMDLAYFPIQFRVIDIVSKIETRSEFSYILNHEAGLYVGRFTGAGTFLLLAYLVSTEVALRYAIIIIAVLQLLSVIVAKKIIKKGDKIESGNETDNSRVTAEVAESINS